SLKAVQMGQSLDEAILDRIEGVRFIAEQAEGHAIGRLPITAKELFQGFPFARRMTAKQLFVARGRETGCCDSGHDAVRTPLRADDAASSCIHLILSPQLAERESRTQPWPEAQAWEATTPSLALRARIGSWSFSALGVERHRGIIGHVDPDMDVR